ncbi:hypothetical protein N0V85_009332 [Neurospora sp. IMI 360204]|nr:hypothetical protein N0V85_009332 [Neurospora sp. IMI 360204]
MSYLRASSAPAITSTSNKATNNEARRNDDAFVHPTLNRIKKNLQARLNDRQKRNRAAAARIKELEECKKYMASMQEVQVRWNDEEAKGKVLEKRMKDLEGDVQEKVAQWEGWETDMGGYVSKGTPEEELNEKIGVEEREVEMEKRRGETEVIYVDAIDQESRVERWTEEQLKLTAEEDDDGKPRTKVDSGEESAEESKVSQSPVAYYSKAAGVSKPIARAKAAKPVARVTTTRPATRAYAKKAAVALKDEESEESEDLSPIIWRRATAANQTAIACPALQPSALAAPAAAVDTETELESLMTIGRDQVEKELKDRIKEEKEKNRLLEKQKIAYRKYQNYLAGLKGLEEDLEDLKADNRMDEDTVMDLAEDFRENTMEWARLFEKYAEDLGITFFDIRKLGEAW